MPKQSRAEALKEFDELPATACVRVPTVAALLGVSDATVWRMTRDGQLPQPKRIGPKYTAWNVGALRQMLGGAA
jgi:predicted DNA-binding transcriptional regulator AlpA